MIVHAACASMTNSKPIAIIGGYDAIAKSFFTKVKSINNESIFINVHKKKIIGKRIYNFEIFQLKKILETLKNNKINSLLFIGKINRPNLSNFRNDGVVDKFVPILIDSYKKGDGAVLLSVLNIFKQKGFHILAPDKITDSFFLNKTDLDKCMLSEDKIDVDKSVRLLNDLSKYDNAQSIVSVCGYIIAIEAVEGTDSLLMRVRSLRKKLGHLGNKSGILTKIPKKNQSMLVDLPVIGPKTLKLVSSANLNGIAIKSKQTLIFDKKNFLKIAKERNLKIYDIQK